MGVKIKSPLLSDVIYECPVQCSFMKLENDNPFSIYLYVQFYVFNNLKVFKFFRKILEFIFWISKLLLSLLKFLKTAYWRNKLKVKLWFSEAYSHDRINMTELKIKMSKNFSQRRTLILMWCVSLGIVWYLKKLFLLGLTWLYRLGLIQ